MFLTAEQKKNLLSVIKQKRELQDLEDRFVLDELSSYLKKNRVIEEKVAILFNSRSQVYKQIIKEVRSNLRKRYGLFRSQSSKSAHYLSALENPLQTKAVNSILSIHSSTKERLAYYDVLYSKIFAITKKPKRIVDLGCGLNPFSYPYMKLHYLSYYAYDVSKKEIDLINVYFKKIKEMVPSFQGQAFVHDIVNVVKIPQSDVAFLFKVTDLLDQGKGHKATEKVLTQLNARYVVISFATKTMSGKKMTAPHRRWMEWLCKRLAYSYTILSFENEIFYVIEKK